MSTKYITMKSSVIILLVASLFVSAVKARPYTSSDNQEAKGSSMTDMLRTLRLRLQKRNNQDTTQLPKVNEGKSMPMGTRCWWNGTEYLCFG